MSKKFKSLDEVLKEIDRLQQEGKTLRLGAEKILHLRSKCEEFKLLRETKLYTKLGC